MLEKDTTKTRVLAFDFGASSGRAIVGTFDSGGLQFEEVHRFANEPIVQDGHLRWNYEALLREVQIGIQKADSFESVGFDTWGVDFGLLDEKGDLLELPVHYRDERTKNICDRVFEKISAEELYARTGNQIMTINTLFQLAALQKENPELLEKARRLLFMPDLFAHALCGSMACETTISSTSQLFRPVERDWDYDLLAKLQIPSRLFELPVKSGTILGNYRSAKVIAVAGHDTQCAVAALPSEKDDIAFLSCGTWALLGTELQSPILTSESMRQGLSNEVGADGKIQYLKNITGLWIIQECRRRWRESGFTYSYAELAGEAAKAEGLRSFIDPDAPEFASPGDMPSRIREYCQRTRQPVPQNIGEICRCVYESLALKVRYSVEQLGALCKKSFSALHILGGGSNIELLCTILADCTGLPVIAGPSEATALGNILIQLHALGRLKSLTEGRKLIEKSQQVKRFEPYSSGKIEEAYIRFCNLINKN